MAKAACILDYNNFYPHRPLGNQAFLEHQISEMARAAVSAVPEVDEIDIRVYGGWHQNGLLTKQASQIEQELANINPFPALHPSGTGLLRGRVALVSELASLPEVHWADTFRTSRGLPRLHIEQEDVSGICDQNRDGCPVFLLRRFSKRKTKTCPVTDCQSLNEKAFRCRQQKMVDALMICDAIFLARDSEVAVVLVFTDDVDILPGVAMAKQTAAADLKLYFSNRQLEARHAGLLKRLGVRHELWTAA